MISVGIDCGAKNTKTVILREEQVIGKGLALTGFDQSAAIEKSMEAAIQDAAISKEDIEGAVHQRMNRPIFLIDITVPRNIDPAVKDVDNAFVFDIDDLKAHVGHNQDERLKEAKTAEKMVKEEVEGMVAWVRGLEATPTIVALRKKAEDIKNVELEKAFHRLGEVSEKDRSAIEGLASAIVNKLLHGPLVTLKTEAQSQNGFAFIEAARRFFELRERDIHSLQSQQIDPGMSQEISEESLSKKDGL